MVEKIENVKKSVKDSEASEKKLINNIIVINFP